MAVTLRIMSLASALMLGLTVTVAAASAQTPPSPAASDPLAVQVKGIRPSEVLVPFSRRIDFTSKVNGVSYTLFVALPLAPPPKEGYPVVYVLDGADNFGSATDAARGDVDVVVVGILYPIDDADFIAKTLNTPKRASGEVSIPEIEQAILIRRTFDLTPPTSEASISAEKAIMKAEKIPGSSDIKAGGVDAFLKVIETEIKPRIHALVKVDAGDEALYGHSLGGLAVLRALFTEPTAFRTFIAASPSIWWDNKAVLEGEAGFTKKVLAGAVAPRVLITVGGLEQHTPAVLLPGMGLKQEEVDARVKKDRMVDNAVELGQRLSALKGALGYEVKTVIFADETHDSVEQAAVSRGVYFAAKGADLKP